MEKRKSRKLKPATKKKIKLETTFDCPFCNHKDSVECELDNKEKKYRYGTASCWVCEERYSTRINALTEPIDLYHEWIDECERVNNVEDEVNIVDVHAAAGTY